MPSSRAVPPENVFAPERIHLPVPCLRMAVVAVGPLSETEPASSANAAVDPLRVSVFEPAPLAVNGPRRKREPEPD